MNTYQHFASVLTQLLGNETAVRLTVNGYMPLSIESIGTSADGNRLIAICHYGEQNGDLMRDPEMVDFSTKDLAVETIEQSYFTVDPERKFDLLVKLLERENPQQAIVFCRTKRGTDKVCRRLSDKFKSVDTIHGDLQQSARDRVMRHFREGKTKVLVATDVVGRGIDVTTISHIINYDIPQFCDDYVHRVGRTGRMGREGVAYTFVSPEEGGELTRIEIRINRLLIRDEIPGFQAFDDPRNAGSIVLGDGPGGMEDDLVEPPKSLPVFGKKVRRTRRAL